MNSIEAEGEVDGIKTGSEEKSLAIPPATPKDIQEADTIINEVTEDEREKVLRGLREESARRASWPAPQLTPPGNPNQPILISQGGEPPLARLGPTDFEAIDAVASRTVAEDREKRGRRERFQKKYEEDLDSQVVAAGARLEGEVLAQRLDGDLQTSIEGASLKRLITRSDPRIHAAAKWTVAYPNKNLVFNASVTGDDDPAGDGQYSRFTPKLAESEVLFADIKNNGHDVDVRAQIMKVQARFRSYPSGIILPDDITLEYPSSRYNSLLMRRYFEGQAIGDVIRSISDTNAQALQIHYVINRHNRDDPVTISIMEQGEEIPKAWTVYSPEEDQFKFQVSDKERANTLAGGGPSDSSLKGRRLAGSEVVKMYGELIALVPPNPAHETTEKIEEASAAVPAIYDY